MNVAKLYAFLGTSSKLLTSETGIENKLKWQINIIFKSGRKEGKQSRRVQQPLSSMNISFQFIVTRCTELKEFALLHSTFNFPIR
jgi:hypothetical protein